MASAKTDADQQGGSSGPPELIAKESWTPFFDCLSRLLEGKRAEVEVASLGLGGQIEAEWAPLIGVSYDHKDNVFSVAVGDVDHLIQLPRTVAVRWEGPALESLAITDSSGTIHLVRFGEPLMLPPP
jgi:hypothetical protein